MKKVIVVSKTHLDLGFTDYADNIKKKYLEKFIPEAVDLASNVNTADKKNFIWTTGSWILKEALLHSSDENKDKLKYAIINGNIAHHAMPFTTHTELLDEDSLDYGLEITEELDELRGKKTITAKMTDVPGHTKSIVKILAKHDIKLLHIGVNGASAVPEVPECFLWKNGESEVVVIYSGEYGGAFKSEFADEILYLDHTVDNRGAPSPEKLLENLEKIKEQYPDYEVEAGTLDEYAEIIWEKREFLPVFEGEIGDSWIHGSAADPYKSAALQTLIRLKNAWLKNGTLYRQGNEYKAMADAILYVAEHTCGMDNKTYFADYENYLKKDFQKARAKDTVVIRHPFRDYPQNMLTVRGIKEGYYKHGSYKVIEKSWQEQREIISNLLKHLSPEHCEEALKSLSALKPQNTFNHFNNNTAPSTVKVGDWELSVNRFGGIGSLTYKGKPVIKPNNNPIAEYHLYKKADYDFWLSNYSRNLEETAGWIMGDFSRPLLKYVDKKYPGGRYPYKAVAESFKATTKEAVILVDLKCKKFLCDDAGAPKDIQIKYHLTENGLTFDVAWFNKDASRLTEAMFLRLFPADGELKLLKISDWIKPEEVVSKGGRNLHAVKKCKITTNGNEFEIINLHSPVLSVGAGKILEFDNKIEDYKKDGISYVLHNNVWGTNFPLWYEDNARFTFIIKKVDRS